MGLGRDIERGYELDREGETFVIGNPRPSDLNNPEVDGDTRTTGLSGEQAESDDILLAAAATAELDGDLQKTGRANLDRVPGADDPATHPHTG